MIITILVFIIVVLFMALIVSIAISNQLNKDSDLYCEEAGNLKAKVLKMAKELAKYTSHDSESIVRCAKCGRMARRQDCHALLRTHPDGYSWLFYHYKCIGEFDSELK